MAKPAPRSKVSKGHKAARLGACFVKKAWESQKAWEARLDRASPGCRDCESRGLACDDCELNNAIQMCRQKCMQLELRKYEALLRRRRQIENVESTSERDLHAVQEALRAELSDFKGVRVDLLEKHVRTLRLRLRLRRPRELRLQHVSDKSGARLG